MPHYVFIASSSEGVKVAQTVKTLLLKKLRQPYRGQVWNAGTFELTKTFIESLEKEVNKADFAVLVLTRDDELVTRKTKTSVPRDNVLFELGLFIGKLGRERCFYIQPHGLKLPTDLLGIESPKFELPKGFTGKLLVAADRTPFVQHWSQGVQKSPRRYPKGSRVFPAVPSSPRDSVRSRTKGASSTTKSKVPGGSVFVWTEGFRR